MMSTTIAEALAHARKLCRTLASAPLPQVRAKEVFQTLVRAHGWSAAQEQEIIAFGKWLDSRPAPGAMKDRCERMLNAL